MPARPGGAGLLTVNGPWPKRMPIDVYWFVFAVQERRNIGPYGYWVPFEYYLEVKLEAIVTDTLIFMVCLN